MCDSLVGILPSELLELKWNPGVGTYTTAAIASFANRQNLQVVDSNVVRVMRRYTGNRILTAPRIDSFLCVSLGPL